MARQSQAIKKKAFLAALELELSNITAACKASGVGRRNIYRWIETDPAFKKAIEDVEELTFDFVEGKLMTEIKTGNTAVMIFFAKTKMKRRGYIERSEVAVSDSSAFVVKDSQKGALKILETIKKNNAKAS